MAYHNYEMCQPDIPYHPECWGLDEIPVSFSAELSIADGENHRLGENAKLRAESPPVMYGSVCSDYSSLMYPYCEVGGIKLQVTADPVNGLKVSGPLPITYS
jgi:hypothetical protein